MHYQVRRKSSSSDSVEESDVSEGESSSDSEDSEEDSEAEEWRMHRNERRYAKLEEKLVGGQKGGRRVESDKRVEEIQKNDFGVGDFAAADVEDGGTEAGGLLSFKYTEVGTLRISDAKNLALEDSAVSPKHR